MAKNEPRKHHFINAAMLAGFTLRGGQRDDLHAVDLRRRAHRKSTPRKEGFRNDYYKISAPGVDPMAIEKQFGRDVEPHFAELLRHIREKGQLPADAKGYGALISLIAVLCTRVPHARKGMERGYEQIIGLLDNMTREHYPVFQKSMRDIGEDDSPEAFEEYRKDGEELDKAGGRWTVDRTTLVLEEMKLAAGIFDVLYERTWTLLVSKDPNADFICSDAPVVVTGPSGGLGMRDTKIHVPLTRRHAVLGTWQGAGPRRALDVAADVVATFNGQTINLTHEMIWAPDDRFVFMAPDATIQRGHDALLGELQKVSAVGGG